ncbi:MAG TPA: hypothetical protein DDW52_16690 [Planctomycetaceae bacterium]|nr:hypothetical protein [Planctomycetaceae bacterium]
MTTQELAPPSFHTLAEEFIRCYRENSAYSVEEFAKKHPYAKQEILEEFPALILAEVLKGSEGQPAGGVGNLPNQIGPYQLKRQLGRGGMGVVFAGRHVGLEKDVAIKMLPLQTLRSPSLLQRFHVEARASAAMDHPNIVPVYDHGIHDRFAYIVMRRVHGASLDMLVHRLADSQKPGASPSESKMALDWLFIAKIGSQIASALQYAHEQGVIHRDIKPANMILDKSGKTWVTDFGLAKVLKSDLQLSMTGDVVGTPRYMAPEQLRGSCDARSDIYGLGLTLYEIATGTLAWSSVAGGDLLAQRCSLELPDIREVNPAVPEGLARIIMACCELAPEDRYQEAKEVSHMLNRFSHGDSVADRRHSRSRRRIMRKRTLAGIGAATLCVASLVGWGVAEMMAPENPYQDKESAYKLLHDEQVRSRFVKELPSLIGEFVTDDSEEVRDMVADLATEAFGGVEALPKGEQRDEIESEIRDVREAFKEGGLQSQKFVSKMTDLAVKLNENTGMFKQASQAISDSGLSEKHRKLGQALLQYFSVTLQAQKLPEDQTKQLLSAIQEISRRLEQDGQVEDMLVSRTIARLRSLYQVHMSKAGTIQNSPSLPGKANTETVSASSRNASDAKGQGSKQQRLAKPTLGQPGNGAASRISKSEVTAAANEALGTLSRQQVRALADKLQEHPQLQSEKAGKLFDAIRKLSH